MRARPEEAAAAQVVHAHLGGHVVPRDVPGAPEGTHDFDLVTDLRTIAFEVTRAADPALRSAWAAVENGADQRSNLRWDWAVFLQADPGRAAPDVAPVRRRAPSMLAVLEEHDVMEFDCMTPDHTKGAAVTEVVRRFRAMGVVRGRAWSGPVGDDGRRVIISLTGGFGTSPEVVNAVAATEVENNHAKLMAADSDERHLFIWVDDSANALELSVHTGHLPGPPSWLDGVDAVWLARLGPLSTYDDPPAHLWRAFRCRAWERLI